MQEGIDKVDIAILYILHNQGKFSPLCSWQAKNFLNDEKFISNFQSFVSYNTIVRRLNKLCEIEYINMGYKDRNANTYFLTQKGIQFIEHEFVGDDIENENIINEEENNNE